MGQIRDASEDIIKLALHCIQLDFALIKTLTHGVHFSNQRGNIFACGFGFTDVFGARVAVILQLFSFSLNALAFGFKLGHARHIQLIVLFL